MGDYQEYNLEGISAKDFLREICYSAKHRELVNMIIKMRREESSEQTNKLMDLFMQLSDDLFVLYKKMS